MACETARDALTHQHSLRYKAIRLLHDAYILASIVYEESERAEIVSTLRSYGEDRTWLPTPHLSEREFMHGMADVLEQLFKNIDEE